MPKMAAAVQEKIKVLSKQVAGLAKPRDALQKMMEDSVALGEAKQRGASQVDGVLGFTVFRMPTPKKC